MVKKKILTVRYRGKCKLIEWLTKKKEGEKIMKMISHNFDCKRVLLLTLINEMFIEIHLLLLLSFFSPVPRNPLSHASHGNLR